MWIVGELIMHRLCKECIFMKLCTCAELEYCEGEDFVKDIK